MLQKILVKKINAETENFKIWLYAYQNPYFLFMFEM